METSIKIKTSEKSLLEKYGKDHSKDAFIIKKGEQARKLLEKINYPVKK